MDKFITSLDFLHAKNTCSFTIRQTLVGRDEKDQIYVKSNYACVSQTQFKQFVQLLNEKEQYCKNLNSLPKSFISLCYSPATKIEN